MKNFRQSENDLDKRIIIILLTFILATLIWTLVVYF